VWWPLRLAGLRGGIEERFKRIFESAVGPGAYEYDHMIHHAEVTAEAIHCTKTKKAIISSLLKNGCTKG
jgi:hypothetical protein